MTSVRREYRSRAKYVAATRMSVAVMVDLKTSNTSPVFVRERFVAYSRDCLKAAGKMTSTISSETSESSQGGIPSVTGTMPENRVTYAKANATASITMSAKTLMDV